MANKVIPSDLTSYGAPDTAKRIREAAVKFLDSLSPQQRAVASFDFADEEQRFFWHYTPIDRQGLTLKDMDDGQRAFALALAASGLSDRGFRQAQAIMDHELILGDMERTAGTVRFDRNPNLYYFSVFGDPAGDAPWSCRIEGHHVSLHYTVIGNELLAITPSFFGANPARVPSGPNAGLRILDTIEDQARHLMYSFDQKQQAQALIDVEAPADLLTTNSRRVELDKMEGLPAPDMSSDQQQTLTGLLKEYIQRKSPEVARREIQKLEARGIDDLRFAWAGGLESGQPHYYRIHGATFFVEYDNTQNDANHIHSVWRDLTNDFGVDLLRFHYQRHHAG